MTITKNEFKFVSELVESRSGIHLPEDKNYLIESRLLPISRAEDLKDVRTLISLLKSGNERLEQMVVEALTTNETFFFRDSKPFDYFRETLMPHFKKSAASDGRLRIWSAACSTGQEAYSLAITLRENPHLWDGIEIEIIGTDINSTVVNRAREGIYSQFEAQRGLPITALVKHFEQKEEQWHIKQEVKDMVRFEVDNLMEPAGKYGRFDLIFCRNVLIYFEEETKQKVLENLKTAMHGHTLLLASAADDIPSIDSNFEPFEPNSNVFKLKGT